LTLFLTWITAWSAAAQTWDNTGNNLLNGTYYFRNVSYHVADSAGDLDYAAALYGTINFDGNGNYTMNAPWLVDSGGNNQASSNVTGTYTIAASGFGFLDNPLGDSVYGLVSNGIFVGSSTESGNNDLFIAVTTASKATSATLVGNYSIAYMNVLDGSPGNTYDALGQFTADGRGNIGTATFTAYLGASGSTAIPITEPGVRYIFSNGAGNISFPTSGNPAVRGTQFLYISPDGNFVFGGSNSKARNSCIFLPTETSCLGGPIAIGTSSWGSAKGQPPASGAPITRQDSPKTRRRSRPRAMPSSEAITDP
jgi:hypothetical protein